MVTCENEILTFSLLRIKNLKNKKINKKLTLKYFVNKLIWGGVTNNYNSLDEASCTSYASSNNTLQYTSGCKEDDNNEYYQYKVICPTGDNGVSSVVRFVPYWIHAFLIAFVFFIFSVFLFCRTGKLIIVLKTIIQKITIKSHFTSLLFFFFFFAPANKFSYNVKKKKKKEQHSTCVPT
ncbi:hypothetical protein RFI_20546 [Reticulomyxa filosa]|uniref:Uncharacterized protein n=1 Tax=Reticulomyxa filosa TaxID=46433 RepID=X6MUL1_RETFI|nr:hypothetical protein RFI_20546 [Reticulomyxa filosa]|eukprot:ETO16795.1 hypothetical protein RFI_20546 [Reticulomyxa filosa]